jgi:hypothetical protein
MAGSVPETITETTVEPATETTTETPAGVSGENTVVEKTSSTTASDWWDSLPDDVKELARAAQANREKAWNEERVNREKAWEAEKAELSAALEKAKAKDIFADLLGEDERINKLVEEAKRAELAVQERDTSLQTKEKELAEIRTRLQDLEDERTDLHHKQQFPDIYEDFQEDAEYAAGKKDVPEPKGAYVDFCKMLAAGFSEERAAALVRAELATKEAPRKVDVPPGVEFMSRKSAPRPSSVTHVRSESYAEVMRRMREQTFADE